MSTLHNIQTIIEALLIFLLLYGFVHEEVFLRMEAKIKRIVIGHYRRYKRLHNIKVIK